MIKEPIANALFWKYYKDGSTIKTALDDFGNWSITAWKITDGTPEPKESEILQTITDYKAFLSQQTSETDGLVTSISGKFKSLGLTDAEIKYLQGKLN